MNDEKSFLYKRIEEIEDAPKLFATFLAIFVVLLFIRPTGWQFYWAFLIGGTVAGAIVVATIYRLSVSGYRVASMFRVFGGVILALILWRSVSVSPLGAMLWGFAFSVPPKLLLIIFRRPLTTAIDRSLVPNAFDNSRNA
jgi:hypothetical protein